MCPLFITIHSMPNQLLVRQPHSIVTLTIHVVLFWYVNILFDPILTVHCHRDYLCGSITIFVEWSASEDHLTLSFISHGWMCYRALPNCSVYQTLLLSVQSVLCSWAGIRTASQVERFAQICNVGNQICREVRAERAIVYNQRSLS